VDRKGYGEKDTTGQQKVLKDVFRKLVRTAGNPSEARTDASKLSKPARKVASVVRGKKEHDGGR